MSIQDIATKVAAEHKLPKVEAERVVRSVLGAIAEGAAGEGGLSLHGFGKFAVKEKPARKARNPRTGETVDVAASRKLTFQPAKALKDRLNGAA